MRRLSLPLVLLAACAPGIEPDPGAAPTTAPSPPKGAVSYLALGDSYTIGEGVMREESWPEQLTARLRSNGIEMLSPRIIAQTGWTTDELREAMTAVGPLGSHDLVSLQIGVNNQFRGYPLGGYREELAELIDIAIELAGGRADRVVVLSIPDWAVTPFGQAGYDGAAVAADIDRFNAAAAEIAGTRGVEFIDVTRISREAGAEGEMLAGDGLHPSGAMYRLWAETVERVVVDRLR